MSWQPLYKATKSSFFDSFQLTPHHGDHHDGFRPLHRPHGFKPSLPLSEAVYYDPTKLSFIFSTPSPLSKRFMALRDREALQQLKTRRMDLDPPKTKKNLGERRQQLLQLVRPTKTTSRPSHPNQPSHSQRASQPVYFQSSSELVPLTQKAPQSLLGRPVQWNVCIFWRIIKAKASTFIPEHFFITVK